MTESVVPMILERARKNFRAVELRLSREYGLCAHFKPITGHVGPLMQMEHRERVMLGSNNYLGLTSHPKVIEGAQRALARYGTGMTGSRLMNGTIDLHAELEAELAGWLGTEDALVFTTGYQANLGMLSALLGPGDAVLCDSADHASIFDGATLSQARAMPFRHGRIDRLGSQLRRLESSSNGNGVLVAVDGVFSMEGDVADVPRLASICRQHGAALAVDEAHAIGVLGAHGEGAAAELGASSKTDIRIGTFSKSLASCGGFVAADAGVIESLRVNARSFVFSASAVPAAVGAALAAVRICRSNEGTALIRRLHENVAYLRSGLRAIDLPVVEPSRIGGRDVPSAIVPIVVGHDYHAILLWKALYDRGVYTNAALYPAMPKNRALVRMSVMATHQREHLDRAVEAIAEVAKETDVMRDQATALDSIVQAVVRGEAPRAEELAAVRSLEGGP